MPGFPSPTAPSVPDRDLKPPSLLRRYPRSAYFAAGFVLAWVTALVSIFWIEIFPPLLGTPMSWDSRPGWLRVLMWIITWLPLIVLGVLVIVRMATWRRVHPGAFFAGVAAQYVVAVVLVLGRPVVEDLMHRQRFESAAWRANVGRNTAWPARLRMVDDLLDRHDLGGLTRPQVERLLGPADDTDMFSEWDMVYNLGPERGLISMDDEWLVIRIGGAGTVTDYRVVTD